MNKACTALLVLLVVWFSCPLPMWGRSLEEIARTKEIRVCLSPIHPSVCTAQPAGCRDDCRFEGPAYEAVLAFVATLGNGIAPRFFRVGWDEQFFNKDGVTVYDASYTPELLASERCDLYPSNLAKNEWRLNKMDFVTMFPNRRMVVVKRSEKDRFKSPADLAGKTAAVVKDTSHYAWLQQQNRDVFSSRPITIRAMSMEESLNAVSRGEADFTMMDSDAAIWAIRHEHADMDMAFAVGTPDEIGWAFRKQDKELQESVKTFFDHQRARMDSTLNRIWQKYYNMSLTDFVRLISSIP